MKKRIWKILFSSFSKWTIWKKGLINSPRVRSTCCVGVSGNDHLELHRSQKYSEWSDTFVRTNISLLPICKIWMESVKFAILSPVCYFHKFTFSPTIRVYCFSQLQYRLEFCFGLRKSLVNGNHDWESLLSNSFPWSILFPSICLIIFRNSISVDFHKIFPFWLEHQIKIEMEIFSLEPFCYGFPVALVWSRFIAFGGREKSSLCCFLSRSVFFFSR